MCGKFELKRSLAQILADFGAETSLVGLPAFQTALPGMSLPVIAKGRLGLARWGWPLGHDDRPLINIRIETVATKPLFSKDWAAGRRCVVPATGFFEKGRFFYSPAHEVFGLCGLWTRGADEQIFFAILTQDAHDPVRPYHHRMPVIACGADAEAWCGGGPTPPPVALALKDLAGSGPLL